MIYDKPTMKTFKKVVKQLKKIEINGESTQHLLEQIGMDDQMLRQLIMSMPFDIVDDYYNERLAMDGITNPIKRRMDLIKDDLRVIYQKMPTELLALPTEHNDELQTCFNNIEIACDLNDDESLGWQRYSEADARNKTIGEKLTDFYKAIAEEEEYFEYDSFQGTCHIQCSGSHISYNCTPFFDSSKGIPVEIVMNDDYKNFFVIECDEPTNDEELNKFKLFYLDIVQMFVRALNY